MPFYVWSCVGLWAAAAMIVMWTGNLATPLEGVAAVGRFLGVDVNEQLAAVEAYVMADIRVEAISQTAFAVLALGIARSITVGILEKLEEVEPVVGSTVWVALLVMTQTGRVQRSTVWLCVIAGFALVAGAWSSEDRNRRRSSYRNVRVAVAVVAGEHVFESNRHQNGPAQFK